jgi:hypothetical protein
MRPYEFAVRTLGVLTFRISSKEKRTPARPTGGKDDPPDHNTTRGDGRVLICEPFQLCADSTLCYLGCDGTLGRGHFVRRRL